MVILYRLCGYKSAGVNINVMILDKIISTISGILIAVITLFPYADTTTLTTISSNLTPFKTYLSNANWLFPVTELGTIIGLAFAIEGIILAIKIVHWIIKNLSIGFVK